MADSRYPITVKRNIFKRFEVKLQKKIRTKEGLRRIMNNAERRISEETIRRAAVSFLRRVEKCALKEGGYFEDEI